MKKRFYLLGLLILPMFLAMSCENDGLSLGDQWLDYAVVDNPNSEPYFFLHTDDGDLLWVAATNFHGYRPKSGQRVIINYTKLSNKPEGADYDHDVKLNDVYNILTKGVFELTEATQDSIGRDPLVVRDMWVSYDFLNVKFSYNGFNKTHYITLAHDASDEYDDGKIHLELRHNSHKDQEVYRYNGIASFNLSSLKAGTDGDRIDIVIHYEDYEGMLHSVELTYGFENEGSQSESPSENDITSFQEGEIG